LAASFGRGAMTNHWVDFKNSDVFLVIGANPAENHPCGWKWAYVARDTRGAKIIHVDPRFTRTSATADSWVPIRAGTDVTFFGALVNHVLQNELYHEDYVKVHTNASFIVSKDFEFNDGLFSGYDPETRSYAPSTWDYERIPGTETEGNVVGKNPPTPDDTRAPQAKPGFAKRDMTLQHPRSVFQLLREHFSRYTPQMVEEVCGIPQDKFVEVADTFGATGTPDKAGSVVYSVGLTHHTSGVQIIRGIGILQLLLGNVGKPGGGVNAERGHANIQGNTDNAQSWEILPGYLPVPRPGAETLDDYINGATLAQLDPTASNFLGANLRKFTVSMLKAFYGDAATKKNDFAFSWLPKPDKDWGWLTYHNEALQGRLHGLFNSGMSSVNIGGDSGRMIESLASLRWFVVTDPFITASAEFWKAPDSEVAPEDIQTEVFFLPTSHWIEKSGAFTNSGRWAQWKHAALPKEGDIKDDNEILAALLLRLQDLYREEGGAFPDPILNLSWPYTTTENPALDEVSKEMNGKDLTTGLQMSTFLDAQEDGSTAIGNWIYTGSFTEDGNMMDRRGTEDPTGMGFFHEWGWSWPANRRVLYNRASADAKGEPWDPTRPGIKWNGSLWVGDVPDYPPDAPPDSLGAFIMTGEGVARLFAPGSLLRDGPMPEHYEQVDSPIENPFSQVQRNPTAIYFDGAEETFADVGDPEFPYVATTYRLTEHEHFVTQNVPQLVEAMPDFFVEIPPELAERKGIANTDMVRVRSKRGKVEGLALVTKRMRPLRLGNKVVYQVGIPVHWHYAAGHSKGKAAQMANLLTPYVGDGTTSTPEYKGFLVDVEKV
jgi:formate dehydrogenase major subunit